jgi:tetratricopeptide (TPR) repeat protein
MMKTRVFTFKGFVAAAMVAGAALLSGCATSGVATSSASKRALASIESPTAFNKNVQVVLASDVKSPNCAKAHAVVKAKWNPERALGAASQCLAARDYNKANDLGQWLAIHEPTSAWGPYVLAAVAKAKGEKERALWMSALAVRRGPGIAAVQYLRGQVQWVSEDFAGAVISFERATEIDSTLVPAHLFLGQAYYREQNFQSATRHFYAVLKVQPQNAMALSGLAESELRVNNLSGALDAYTRLVDAHPQEVQYKMRLEQLRDMDRMSKGERAMASEPRNQGGRP